VTGPLCVSPTTRRQVKRDPAEAAAGSLSLRGVNPLEQVRARYRRPTLAPRLGAREASIELSRAADVATEASENPVVAGLLRVGDPGLEPGTSSLSGASGCGPLRVRSGPQRSLLALGRGLRVSAGRIRPAEASMKLPGCLPGSRAYTAGRHAPFAGHTNTNPTTPLTTANRRGCRANPRSVRRR
jgi:hypothetical protein